MKNFKDFFKREYLKKEQMRELYLLLNKYHNRRVVFTTENDINMNIVFDQYAYGNPVREKPVGLWYSRGGEWLDFMMNEYDKPYYKYKNVYYIEPDYRRILRINSKDKILKFVEQYGESYRFESIPHEYKKIDWGRVADDYAGIEIIPKRYDYNDLWYEGWDISSGCIWNTRFVKKAVHLYNYKEGIITDK